MKTLVRDLDTGLLYCSPGTWVENWMVATDFGDIEDAWRLAESLGKENLEVCLMEDDGCEAWRRRIDPHLNRS
jgi:hypothetical protein